MEFSDSLIPAIQHLVIPSTTAPASTVTTLYSILTPFLEQELGPLLVSRRPVPLDLTPQCGRFPQVLTGTPLQTPGKAYMLFGFNTELDLLEATLYELEEVVDQFVIVEATVTSRAARKPLYFARNQARFARFLPKIVHVVIDDSLVQQWIGQDLPQGPFWNIEKLTRDHLFNRFLSPGGVARQFGPNDVTLFGDVDEIVSAEFVRDMKGCQWKPEAQSQVVAPHIMKTIGDMAHGCYPWSHMVIAKSSAFRTPTRDGSILLPCCNGLHVSSYLQPAVFLAKYLSIAEAGCSSFPPKWHDMSWLRFCTTHSIYNYASDRFCKEPVPMVPWVVQHNPQRYPFLVANYPQEELDELAKRWTKCPSVQHC